MSSMIQRESFQSGCMRASKEVRYNDTKRCLRFKWHPWNSRINCFLANILSQTKFHLSSGTSAVKLKIPIFYVPEKHVTEPAERVHCAEYWQSIYVYRDDVCVWKQHQAIHSADTVRRLFEHRYSMCNKRTSGILICKQFNVTWLAM